MAPHAVAYQDPGTPEEQSRRQFLANATIAVGGVIGAVIGIPCVISLIPESLVSAEKSGGGVWTPLAPSDVAALDKATQAPVKMNIAFKYQDGYLPPADDNQFVWGVKLAPDQAADFQKSRPDLFTPGGKVSYSPVAMNFVIFSSICPHLGCKFNWAAEEKRFICPCHNSQFNLVGDKLSGPAPRGLDPLPFREKSGKAEVTWIRYKPTVPDRIVISYSN